MRFSRKAVLGIVLVAIFLLPNNTFASERPMPKLEDRVVLGGTFHLYEGEYINGSLVVLGGNVTLDPGSSVEQDVILIASTATLSGEVGHDLIGIGGVIALTETAVVYGDLVAPGSVLNRDSAAIVEGQVVTQGSTVSIDIPEFSRVDVFSNPPVTVNTFGRSAAPALSFLWFTFRVFAFSAIAVFMVMLIPKNTQRTRAAMMNYPVLSGGFGLLTLFASMVLIILFAISIILSPISALIFILIGLGILTGWLTLGVEIGNRLNNAFDQKWPLALQAGLGTFALTLVAAALSVLLWGGVGWILGITIGAIGLGAVMLTRFGTREYMSQINNKGEINVLENNEK